MVVDWTDNFICSICNTSRKVVRELRQGIDPDTKNPFRIIEMDCGHTEKTTRISKEVTLRWEISKGENLRVDPADTDGTPSVAVSSGGQTTIIAGGVSFNFKEAKNNNFIVITAVQAEGNSNVQNLFETHINITYNDILKEIDTHITEENERKEIKNILEEIKNDLKSRRIPDSGLLQKLKGYDKEKIADLVYKWTMRGIELVFKTGYFNP